MPSKSIRSLHAVAPILLVALIVLLAPETLKAQGFLFGPQVPLAESFRTTIRGDYVAAGVGMRNVGSGSINIALPAQSVIKKSFLYWAVISPTGPAAPATGSLNGTPVNGTLVGTSGAPCWPIFQSEGRIDVYRADVTSITQNGNNLLTGFPSGLTNQTAPQDGLVFPLLDGASLVVIFENPLFDLNTIVIRDGAQSFATRSLSTSFGQVAAAPATALDESAKTTFIVADGQVQFSGERALFAGSLVAGPGSAVRPEDAFNGADGFVSVSPVDGLWDTLTSNVSTLFPAGVSREAVATIDGSVSLDCLCWLTQVMSIKSATVGEIDIKPGSFPNSINSLNSGSIPVAILSSPTFDAPAMIDRDSPTFGKTGFELSLLFCAGVEDVNKDGLDDLVFHFETLTTDLEPGVEVAVLRAQTLAGYTIVAADTVRIIR